MTTDVSPYPTPTVRRKSLSELVEFEDLGLLDDRDLRAVFDEVPAPQVLDALVGAKTGLRQFLLTRLPATSASKLEAEINERGPVSFESVRAAQRAVVETLCRLSRGGMVAFDDPEDMVA
jgi:flagellar motor switch protein FliG